MMNKLIVTESVVNQSISDLLLERLDALIYICRIDTYEILYMNKYAKELYGDGVGQVCWKWFHMDHAKPCSYCSIHYLNKPANKNHIYISDQFNPLNNKWYEVHDKLIKWTDGKKVKLQIAYNIDHRKKDEKKLMGLYKQQELFSEIATSFNRPLAFADKVNEVLDLVGNFANLSRVSIFHLEKGKHEARLIYEWCQKGITPKINYLRELVFDTLHPRYDLINNQRLINSKDLNDPLLKDLFAAFKRFNVRAMLFLPIFLHDEHIGYISFEMCNESREWQKDEIQLIKTFGNIISTSFERKSIEENRIRSERNLEKVSATKEKFLSIITRDLLSPFSAVSSLSTMLLENYSKWNDEKRLLFIESLRDSAKQGYKLLDNLITWSKMQSGKMDFFPKDVDICSAINLAKEQLMDRAIKKNIRIFGIQQDFIFVYADYMMLHGIIRNLLSNAIKFTPEKGTIEIKLIRLKEFVQLSIIDNGVGIEKAYLNSLFKIDRLSADFGPTEEKGTGLGLIICREFVEKNGGKIWAESKFGQGSCFSFTVPLSR